MANGNSQKIANGSALEFEAHFWAAQSKDVLGRVYEYEKFASAEGKGGGEFCTPK